MARVEFGHGGFGVEIPNWFDRFASEQRAVPLGLLFQGGSQNLCTFLLDVG